MSFPPPEFPYPTDAALVARGSRVYSQHCASCHDVGQALVGTVINIDEVGTDPHRVDAWTQGVVEAWRALAAEYDDFRFETLGKRNGYVAMPLDGVWLRSPYLHNGSVPSLKDLLEPSENRPNVFYRGYDVYDPSTVGFVSGGGEAERLGFRYDTQELGNSNQGHLYGTQLSRSEKEALIEYLKTL